MKIIRSDDRRNAASPKAAAQIERFMINPPPVPQTPMSKRNVTLRGKLPDSPQTLSCTWAQK